MEPVIRLGSRSQGNPKTGFKPKSETKSKLSEVKNLVKVFVESLFEIPAISLKQDFWRLDNEESKQLCDAIIAWMESLPSADQSKIAEFIGKHLPLINLAMVAFFIVSERVKMSFEIYKITQSGTRFAESVKQQQQTQETSRNVRTAMDDLFN